MRRLSQAVFLLFFVWLFLRAAYPYDKTIPSELFLRVSPLAAFSTMLSTLRFISKFIPALILLGLTLFLGRFFCGWICPLGTVIDVSDRIIKSKKDQYNPRFRSWKFAVLVFLLIASVLSVQLVWFFDPLALLNRVFTTFLYPLVVQIGESAFALLFDVKKLEQPLFKIYDFLHIHLLPSRQPFFRQSVIISLIFMGILLLGYLGRRFWCRSLCPLGALLGLFSKFRLLERKVNQTCTDCALCQRKCKASAIEDDFHTYSKVECIECMNCVAECPPRAVSYGFSFRSKSARVDLSRRRFLLAGVSGVLAAGVIKIGYADGDYEGSVIRPPGALEERQFLDCCIRCQECVRICATTGGLLQPAFLESGWEGIWSPIGVPRRGYCEYNCLLCQQVCPTGAIHLMDLAQKQKTRIGIAYFDKSRCIPWYRQEDCLVCEEHCPTPEKAIKFEEKQVVKPDGTKKIVKFPYVVEDLCIGCGICVTKCPVVGKAGIFVTNSGEQRWNE